MSGSSSSKSSLKFTPKASKASKTLSICSGLTSSSSLAKSPYVILPCSFAFFNILFTLSSFILSFSSFSLVCCSFLSFALCSFNSSIFFSAFLLVSFLAFSIFSKFSLSFSAFFLTSSNSSFFFAINFSPLFNFC